MTAKNVMKPSKNRAIYINWSDALERALEELEDDKHVIVGGPQIRDIQINLVEK